MTNVLEWLEHMEAQSGEKIAVADPKEEYSFTQLKMYAQKGGTYLRKWMTGTAPVAIYMEKSCVTLIHPPNFDIVEIIYSESEKAL